MRSQDQAFSSHTAELIQYSSYDEVMEVAVEEEISVQHSQPVVARLLTEMEERLLADNLDEMHGTEYAIEEVAQDMLNVSRRTQLTGQAGYSLSPLDFRNSSGILLTRPDSRANAQDLLIHRGYQVVPVNTAYHSVILRRYKSYQLSLLVKKFRLLRLLTQSMLTQRMRKFLSK